MTPTRRSAGAGPPPIALVVTPHATAVRADRNLPAAASEALRAARARVQVHVTDSPDALAALLPPQHERLALVGGDGDVHLAADLPGPTPELALLPTGGPNTIAASLGIPTELGAAAFIAVLRSAR